jgi:hypothetical protein
MLMKLHQPEQTVGTNLRVCQEITMSIRRGVRTRACRVEAPSTRGVRTEAVRRHECRRGTQECVRHILFPLLNICIIVGRPPGPQPMASSACSRLDRTDLPGKERVQGDPRGPGGPPHNVVHNVEAPSTRGVRSARHAGVRTPFADKPYAHAKESWPLSAGPGRSPTQTRENSREYDRLGGLFFRYTRKWER